MKPEACKELDALMDKVFKFGKKNDWPIMVFAENPDHDGIIQSYASGHLEFEEKIISVVLGNIRKKTDQESALVAALMAWGNREGQKT